MSPLIVVYVERSNHPSAKQWCPAWAGEIHQIFDEFHQPATEETKDPQGVRVFCFFGCLSIIYDIPSDPQIAAMSSDTSTFEAKRASMIAVVVYALCIILMIQGFLLSSIILLFQLWKFQHLLLLLQ